MHIAWKKLWASFGSNNIKFHPPSSFLSSKSSHQTPLNPIKMPFIFHILMSTFDPSPIITTIGIEIGNGMTYPLDVDSPFSFVIEDREYYYCNNTTPDSAPTIDTSIPTTTVRNRVTPLVWTMVRNTILGGIDDERLVEAILQCKMHQLWLQQHCQWEIQQPSDSDSSPH